MSEGWIILTIVMLPLLGGLIGLFKRGFSQFISPLFVGLAFIVSLIGLFQIKDVYVIKWNWINEFQIGIKYDPPSAILLSLVCLVSLLVHVFSIEYLKDDTDKERYFAKLGFFTFSMLGLLIADHLLLLFIFWELVGFASYLLIGFWYKKESIANSARTAFMVNRIADVSLLSGILILNATEQSLFISQLDGTMLFLPSLLIVFGAFGKSAQLPFSGWLLKAMVGPTPVSALIHAATMVAAGVYLLFRVSPFLDVDVLIIVAFVGSFTTLYGAISAITQNDIKKVLAYSTISQLGYMVVGIGVGAGEASLFHLWTHAFFKAGLFLGAGAVIHYLHQLAKEENRELDAQDMRIMGGLRNKLPWTFFSFLICGFALAGLPLFTGFMSKEGILLATWAWAEQLGTWAYIIPDIALITVLITAFYIGRLIMLVFFGESRLDSVSGKFMFLESVYIRVPLILLALGSIWLVHDFDPFAHHSVLDPFLGKNLAKSDSFIATYSVGISIFFSLIGLMLAFSLFKSKTIYSETYRNSLPSSSFGGRLIFNGFYLSNVYQLVGTYSYILSKGFILIEKAIDSFLHFIAIGGVVLAKVLAIVDRLIVDGVVNLSAYIASFLGKITSGLHAREVQWQMIWLIILFSLISGWILFF
jgi:NADH-quinone oxidoreductase subunit L